MQNNDRANDGHGHAVEIESCGHTAAKQKATYNLEALVFIRNIDPGVAFKDCRTCSSVVPRAIEIYQH
jgi:hypothetical protein